MLKIGRNMLVHKSSERYEDAINLLHRQRRQRRPETLQEPNGEIGKLPHNPSFKGTPSLFDMKGWLDLIGYSDADIDGLNVIHVAGTKGKGSTCAFTRSFLQVHGQRTGFPQRVGLYSSPHLKVMQERIQINSSPISEELFAKYVFEVWNSLGPADSPKPRYTQLLMLVAVHTFIKERVDVAIYEPHIGGEYDATNIFRMPIVTGIASIGMDHIKQLGPSIENIAWHKAGIFKSGCPAFSVPQKYEVAEVLRCRANEKHTTLTFVRSDVVDHRRFPALRAEVQRENAALAFNLANAFLSKKAPTKERSLTEQDLTEGIDQFSWPGRFQRIVQGNHQWFLDGAHNEMSVPHAAQWFAESTLQGTSDRNPLNRTLIFGHLSERDGVALLRSIAAVLQDQGIVMDQMIMTTYEERRDGQTDSGPCFSPPDQKFLEVLQQEYFATWRQFYPQTKTSFEPTIEGALDLAKSSDPEICTQNLVTGSLYLIGGALRLLDNGG